MAVLALPSAAAGQDVTLTPVTTLQAPDQVTALDFSADGRLLVKGDRGGLVTVHDLEAERQLLEVDSQRSAIVFAGFLAGDTAYVSVDDEGRVMVHRIREGADTGSPLARLEVGDRPRRVVLDAGRRYLAIANADSRIDLFDLPTRQRLGSIEASGDSDEILYLGFDRAGRQLVAVTAGGRVTAWNPANLESLRRVRLQGDDLHGSRSVVHAVGADQGANILVVALEEVALPRGGLRNRARPGDLERRDQLLVFDWHSGARIKGVSLPDGAVERLVVGPGNDHAAVARGSQVTLMDLRRGERGAGFSAPSPVSRLSISPDNTRLAVGSEEGEVSVWSMEYREAETVEDLADAPPGLSGRLRVLGEDSPAIAAGTSAVLAVLPFEAREGDERMSRLVAELLTTQLANLEHLTLVERLRIDDLLQELDLRRQGITEDRGLELGRMLNADLVLLGSVGAFGTSHTVSARLLRVETGEVVSGRQVLCQECRAQELFEAIHLLGTTIAR